MNSFAEYSFKVRSYECCKDGYATLPTICNYLQESASMHAEELGFSKANFDSEGKNISWVLTRLKIKINRYPSWNETIKVKTFPRIGRKITAYRDFVLVIGDEVVGLATSEWMLIDLATRKVVVVPASIYGLSNDEQSPVLGTEPFNRLKWDCAKTANAKVFAARNGDIDLNGHVNNVHYVEWVLETLPVESGPIMEIEVVFKSETFAQDKVLVDSVEVAPKELIAHVGSETGQTHIITAIKLK